MLVLVSLTLACGVALIAGSDAGAAPPPMPLPRQRAPTPSAVPLPNFSMILPAGTVPDDFVLLGHGHCINQRLAFQ